MSTVSNPPTSAAAAQVTIKQFLEAGVHFGHQTRRWNPKMAKYIFGERNDIYIIDLKKTMKMFRESCDYAKTIGISGKEILFVGTKKQAQDTIREEATKAGMPYVNHRWLGGMLTNFATVSRSIKRLQLLEKMEADGTLALRSKKEQSRLMKEKDKLVKNLGGIKNMKGLPSAMFVVDPNNEDIAVHEANRLGIPVIAITDTNCDPDPIQWIVPANDDAIRSVQLITSKIAESLMEGRMEFDKQVTDGMVETQAQAEGSDLDATVVDPNALLENEAPVIKDFDGATEIPDSLVIEDTKDSTSVDLFEETTVDDIEEDFQK